MLHVEAIFDERVNGLAEDGGAANAGQRAGDAQSAGDFGGGDFDAVGARRLNVRKLAQGFGSAVCDDFAVIDVGDVTATFGLVHIVSGHEEGDALAGKFEQKIPKLAAGDRID